jgi:hypothetical protein
MFFCGDTSLKTDVPPLLPGFCTHHIRIATIKFGKFCDEVF